MSIQPAQSDPPSQTQRRGTTSLSQQLTARILAAVSYIGGGVLLLFLTFILLGIPPQRAFLGLFVGAFGSAEDGHWYAVSESLVKAVPLLLTGLGVTMAWRAGMFSIGGEGQLIMGAIAATALLKLCPFLPAGLLTLLMLIGGGMAGALWGGIAGWLRTRRNVQEVISTIMLNYIALYLLGALVNGPLQEHTHVSPQSDTIPDAVLFARLIPASIAGGVQPRLHSGLLLALLAVPMTYCYLYQTSGGFGLRLVGQNAEAARGAHYPVDRLRLRAMLLSGALCGLAGTIELLGISSRLDASFSPGWGFTAIPVALLGGLHPFGTLASALFFGALTAGCGYLSRFYGVSSVIVNVIQAVAVLAVVAARAWRNRHAGTEVD